MSSTIKISGWNKFKLEKKFENIDSIEIVLYHFQVSTSVWALHVQANFKCVWMVTVASPAFVEKDTSL